LAEMLQTEYAMSWHYLGKH